MKTFELVLNLTETFDDGTAMGGKINTFRLSLEPDVLNAYRLSSSKERELLLRAIEESMEEHLL